MLGDFFYYASLDTGDPFQNYVDSTVYVMLRDSTADDNPAAVLTMA